MNTPFSLAWMSLSFVLELVRAVYMSTIYKLGKWCLNCHTDVPPSPSVAAPLPGIVGMLVTVTTTVIESIPLISTLVK